ncbi:uncharacterized protein BP5553_02298 [Venustampulla echinocandica]|uniref:Heterokaryon incompatibility domain-containing protein n=1 Tax=Venustampulla echinocandica TaxID=2656787 RepID=A0A370U3G2_9HELO|nr:uncharacterized protein BP5553_02298 [Venustampulla echinocandica]RDL42319.1 hypothetical protein BP5553_02298 [Venustampulla echinocandica]
MDSRISNSLAAIRKKSRSFFQPSQPRAETQPRAEPSKQDPEFLCKQCKALRLNHWLAPRSMRFLYMLPDEFRFEPPLIVSPSSHCAMCRLLAHSLGQTGTVSKLHFQDHGDTETFEGHDTQSISMRVSRGPSQDMGLRIISLGESAFRLSSRRYSYARIVEPEAASRKLMQEWLKTCEHSHSRCKELEQKFRHLPIRCAYLVDVKEMRVRPVGDGPRRYFALSYVWGQVANLQLLKENIAELSEPQSLRRRFESLPRVIQDAITITQELGETFLWIDSLCICQDDSINKHLQIANMNHIYQSAVATLVALHAKDAASGLAGVRPYHKPRKQHIERVHHMEMTTLLPDLHSRQSVYSTRAWTYQEEHFSRRLLYFSDDQVHFRCLKSTYSEDTYEDGPGFPYGRTGQLYGLYPYTEFSWWQKTVAEYSTRDYSFVEDRYNAFEGISNELAKSWNYPCIRGLPIRDIAAAICWEHKFQSSHEVSNRISLHPSWSWCGWTNSIGFSNHVARSKISIELLEDFHFLDQAQLVAGRVKSSMTSHEMQTPCTSKDSNPPGLSFPESPPQPLVLEFFAYSALMEASVISDGFRSQCSIEQPSLTASGFVPIPHAWEGPAKHYNDTTTKIECIMVASSSGQSSSTLSALNRDDMAHIMLIEHKGEYCERVGVGKISKRCFWSFHPISRLIKLN